MNSYSAHADEARRLRFVEQMEAPPERFLLVHGAPDRQAALTPALHEHGPDDVVAPQHGET